MRLVEKGLVKLGRGAIDRSDVEIAPARGIAVPIHDIAVAESLRCLANCIDRRVVAQILWIADTSCLVTVKDLISAPTRHFPSIFHFLHLRVVDSFDAICVVGSHLNVRWPHRQTVGTTIDYQ